MFFFLENSRVGYFWAARVHLLFAERWHAFCFRLCDGSQSKNVVYFFFQKANKNGSDDFNLEVTEK